MALPVPLSFLYAGYNFSLHGPPLGVLCLPRGKDPMSQFSGEERRRSSRITATHPVLLHSPESGVPPTTAFTFSLSQFGCAVRCKASLPVVSRVCLEFEGKKMDGWVTFVLQSSAIDSYEIGIAFDSEASDFWGETF